MDNASRSERTRNAVLQAALTIIARDGANRLTLDAIARESGISKGGLMHQFRTKEAVIRALLEHQIAYFEDFYRGYLAEHASSQSHPQLAAQIATLREFLARPHSVDFAIIGAAVHEPSLLSKNQKIDAERLEAIKAEATDPDLATLRWVAARGLALTSLLGICSVSPEERDRLFDRLADDSQWNALSEAGRPQGATSTAAREDKDR